ncbi:MAG: hypothetical protein IIA89_05445 [Chloroflexi bacterium]|nr:hypothetical protein [Chloroflexota bacterium]
MNADFNVGFIQPQSEAEQMFNRASLREFHGEKVGDFIEQALDGFESSLDGLDGAMEKNEQLIEMLRSEEYELYPEFEEALGRHIVALEVNELPRVSENDLEIKNLEDILLVLQSEFATLRVMTEETIEVTRQLQPQIDEGLFVDTVLRADTPFNQAKIALGFGRGTVESFMSTACHSTILAVEDIYPLGFEFLTDPKVEPSDDSGIRPFVLPSLLVLAVVIGGYLIWSLRLRG